MNLTDDEIAGVIEVARDSHRDMREGKGTLSKQVERNMQRRFPEIQREVRWEHGKRDLVWRGEPVEVKTHKQPGHFVINGSAVVAGEHYLVVNYNADKVTRIWLLREAKVEFFQPRQDHLQLRGFIRSAASLAQVQVIYDDPPAPRPRRGARRIPQAGLFDGA